MNRNGLFLIAATPVLMIGLSGSFSARDRENNSAPPRSGVELYKKYCVSCHGRDGKAQTRKAKFNHARDIADSKWQDEVTDERIFNSIMNGRNVRGHMPAFSKKINDQEVEALVTFVRGLRK